MKYYTCKYCYKEFIPKRRGVQVFCSNSCRSKNHHQKITAKKKLLNTTTKNNTLVTVPEKSPPTDKGKIETMSLAGVGNSTAGNIIANKLQNAFTPLENRPATKGDLKMLANKITKRYHPVNNLPHRSDGALPYFDLQTNEIVYSFYPKLT
ncbi:hypothetical protein [Algibacter mikhailovii]|uniref:Uncharacterized protein n=1 Tax=Algibacter mikhailovii TaxID=425498 RepID=A0A918QRX5_9FLAO|nr:hypothetical protein [Algibacter mikhailovii]GGZ67242.1 hypothetical protein GCM10007028_00090 [Algibacter mikhailovii]